MTSILHLIKTNEIALIIFIVVLVLLAFAIIKKFIKLLLIILIAAALYFGYMIYTDKKVTKTKIEVQKEGSKILDKLK